MTFDAIVPGDVVHSSQTGETAEGNDNLDLVGPFATEDAAVAARNAQLAVRS